MPCPVCFTRVTPADGSLAVDGGPVGFGWALVRRLPLLAVVPPLLAVVPPLITDRDGRGLHDRAADTVVVRP